MKHAHARERNDLIHGSKSHPNSKPFIGELARARGNERRNARVGWGTPRDHRRTTKRSVKRKRVHGPLPRGDAAEVCHNPCAREQGAHASSQRRGSRARVAPAVEGGEGGVCGGGTPQPGGAEHCCAVLANSYRKSTHTTQTVCSLTTASRASTPQDAAAVATASTSESPPPDMTRALAPRSAALAAKAFTTAGMSALPSTTRRVHSAGTAVAESLPCATISSLSPSSSDDTPVGGLSSTPSSGVRSNLYHHLPTRPLRHEERICRSHTHTCAVATEKATAKPLSSVIAASDWAQVGTCGSSNDILNPSTNPNNRGGGAVLVTKGNVHVFDRIGATHWRSKPPMNVCASGASPLISAPEKSKPGCSA